MAQSLAHVTSDSSSTLTASQRCIVFSNVQAVNGTALRGVENSPRSAVARPDIVDWLQNSQISWFRRLFRLVDNEDRGEETEEARPSTPVEPFHPSQYHHAHKSETSAASP